MLGLILPGLEFRMLCLEGSVISPPQDSPGPVYQHVHEGGLKSIHFIYTTTPPPPPAQKNDEILKKHVSSLFTRKDSILWGASVTER